MATQKLEELTIEQLKKKDKETTRLLIFLAVVYLICLTGLLIMKSSMLAVSIFPLLITLLPLIKGRKKIKEELAKRG
jgi:hypothetical protein